MTLLATRGRVLAQLQNYFNGLKFMVSSTTLIVFNASKSVLYIPRMHLLSVESRILKLNTHMYFVVLDSSVNSPSQTMAVNIKIRHNTGLV